MMNTQDMNDGDFVRYVSDMFDQTDFLDSLSRDDIYRLISLAEISTADVDRLDPVAARYDFDGFGYQYIDAGSGSDWVSRKTGSEPLYSFPARVGWRVIPSRPTDEMLRAARDWSREKYGKPIGNDAACEVFRVMVAAALKPDVKE